MSNSREGAFEKIEEIGAATNRIKVAALWLAQSREMVEGSIIAEMKRRFGLRNLEAIEACQQAHVLLFGDKSIPEPIGRFHLIEGGKHGHSGA
ncbi:hypothetical protein AB3G45_25530 [Shinella sp. S4-D37]|uniref:hypothetical protein n=1 Tax=Shinella sp. S4-D37 TaxID=3161999 RepID=UPI0034664047